MSGVRCRVLGRRLYGPLVFGPAGRFRRVRLQLGGDACFGVTDRGGSYLAQPGRAGQTSRLGGRVNPVVSHGVMMMSIQYFLTGDAQFKSYMRFSVGFGEWRGWFGNNGAFS